MKKLVFFLSVFAWLISANAVYADVTAPNVTIQNGGAVSVVWNAPVSQAAKVSVFIPNNATAINALYHVYPNGKSATGIACLSTDATYPCFEIPVNQALNKNKWVQLTLNNDVNTQWTFVKNTGFVTVASNNLGASENLGVAGADFSVSALSSKQIAAKWAKAIASVSGIKKAIAQCLKDNGGIALNYCDTAGYDSSNGLGKYGILQFDLDIMNAAPNTQAWINIGTAYGADANTRVSIDITEPFYSGGLSGCSFHLVPTRGVGTILWHVLAKMESAPAITDADCVQYVKGSEALSGMVLDGIYGGGYAFQAAFRAKWAKAIAAASGVKKAINQCLRDNGGWALGICDSAGVDTTTTLGKYGVTQVGLDTMNAAANTEIVISVGNRYGNDNQMVSIDLTEATAGKLGGCSFHLIPFVYGDAGTIVWRIGAELQSFPATTDSDCVQYVKGSEALSSMSFGGVSSYSGYVYQKAFTAKWAKAIATVSGIKKAITQCLKKSGGVALNTCDAAGNDSSKLLAKYGVTDAGLAQLNTTTNLETQVAIGNVLGDVNSRVSIDITEKVAGSLGGCSFHLFPTVIQGAGAAIIWHTAAMVETAPSVDDMECTGLVKGSEPMSLLVDGLNIMKMYWAEPLKALSTVKQAISRCLIDNAGNKTLCNSVLIANKKLQKYGISSLPAGTGVSDGAATTYNANWISMNMGGAGASNAAIIIKGGYRLEMCKMTLQPTFDSISQSVNWTVFAQTTKSFITNAQCASYINGAIAGAPI